MTDDKHPHRLAVALRKVGEYYRLFGRAQAGDFDAYREFLDSDKFPAAWADVAHPTHLMPDVESIPHEFLLHPIGRDQTVDASNALTAVIVPDDYAIAKWVAEQEDAR